MNKNIIHHNFKNYKKNPASRRKRMIKIFAIVASLLMIFSVAASIFYYL